MQVAVKIMKSSPIGRLNRGFGNTVSVWPLCTFNNHDNSCVYPPRLIAQQFTPPHLTDQPFDTFERALYLIGWVTLSAIGCGRYQDTPILIGSLHDLLLVNYSDL